VQITDTHLGTSESLHLLERVVERINELPFPVACVVHSGDVFADSIADPAVRKKGLRILDRLEPPLYATPGNHDILRRDLERTRRVWSRAFSGLVHTERVQGVRFVFAYTYPLSGSFQVSGYEPLAGVESALAAAGDPPVIVVHHAPSLPELVADDYRGGWSEAERKEWRCMLSQSDVIAVLAGHFHRSELHWLGEVPLYVAPPVASSQGMGAFRVYECKGGRLSYRTIRVSLPEPKAK
jgi:3',5'-cyclic AMP phosphodiesterase CpdA